MNNSPERIKRLVIVGVGLIGGSLASSLKKLHLVDEIIGVGRSEENLITAHKMGLLDLYLTDPENIPSDVDMVLIAVPVAQTKLVFEVVARKVSNSAIITDVGSTKEDIISIAREALGNSFGRFVPAHPIAGGEKNGAIAASDDLFLDKNVVLTPVEGTSESAVNTVERMWQSVGANIVRLDASSHDVIFSAVSHLPHVVSFALVSMLAARSDSQQLFSFAASGFRDFSRIAGSSPEMWKDICQSNKDKVLSDISDFKNVLEKIEQMMRGGDFGSLLDMFQQASDARNKWAERK
jgi:prephenate dehydrogenase